MLSHTEERYTKQCLTALQETASYGTVSDSYNWFQQLVAIILKCAPNLSIKELTQATLTAATPGILDALILQQREADLHRVTQSERFQYYSALTPSHNTAAPYTDICIPLHARRLIAQCRLCQGSFYTMLGYVRINYRSVCDICNKNEENTLWHILCSCPLHNEARAAFFRDRQIPLMQDIYTIFNPTSKSECLKLSRFVNTCIMQIQELPQHKNTLFPFTAYHLAIRLATCNPICDPIAQPATLIPSTLTYSRTCRLEK